jgi:hypothetical protein
MLFGITTEWRSASDRNRVHLRPDSPLFVSTRGLSVFLDAWAIKELVKRDPVRRQESPKIASHSPFDERILRRYFSLLDCAGGAKTRVSHRWANFWKLKGAAHIAVGHTVQRSGRIPDPGLMAKCH